MSYPGDQLFQRFCSGCHGAKAHGDGKIAASLGVAVPDLTLLAQRNHGEFPQERVTKIIDGRINIGKHNTDRTMPVWGEELLRSEQSAPLRT
jgi:mono/diheme cytochrome c family protein